MSAAVTIAGLVSRMVKCEKHGVDYPQVFFPKVSGQAAFWTGECKQCREEGRLLSRARELLAENKSEVIRRAQEQMEQCEADGEIAKSADAEIERYMEDVRSEVMDRRSEWEADVRRRIWEQLVLNLESEMAAEFVEQLQKGK